MRVWLTILFLLGVQILFANNAKQDLEKKCDALIKFFETKKSYHLQYRIQIKGRDAYLNVDDQMVVDLYKKGDLKYSKMGNAAEIVNEDKQVLMINHIGKFLQYGIDTSNKQQNPLEELLVYLKESNNVTIKSDKGIDNYIITFSENHIHERIEFSFNAKTQAVISTYAVFSKEYKEPYYSVRVNYLLWEDNIKSGQVIPKISNYLVKSGNTFKPLPVWEKYQFYQSEKRNLKL